MTIDYNKDRLELTKIDVELGNLANKINKLNKYLENNYVIDHSFVNENKMKKIDNDINTIRHDIKNFINKIE